MSSTASAANAAGVSAAKTYLIYSIALSSIALFWGSSIYAYNLIKCILTPSIAFSRDAYYYLIFFSTDDFSVYVFSNNYAIYSVYADFSPNLLPRSFILDYNLAKLTLFSSSFY